MKNVFTCFLIITLACCLSKNTYGQSTFDLFSRKGLVIGSVWFGDMVDWGSAGSAYEGIDTVCGGKIVLRYIDNFTSDKYYYYINGDKVYRHYSCDSDELLYDFGLKIGDTIQSGFYNQYVLLDKVPITLLNGETATKFLLVRNNNTSEWITGIGGINYALGINSGKFVCAKLNGVLLYERPLSDEVATFYNIDCDLLTCIRPKPRYSPIVNDKVVLFDNTSSYGDNYLWSFGDGTTSNEKSPTHTYMHQGCYTVTFQVTNSCFPEGYTIKNNLGLCTENKFTFSDTIPLNYYSSFCNVNNNLLFYTLGTTLYRSNNNGETWTKQSILSDLNEERQALVVKMWNDKKGIMGTNNLNYQESKKCIMVTDDGGETWTTKVDSSYWVDNIVIDSGGIAWVSAGRYYNHYYRTSDFGVNWEKVNYALDNDIVDFKYLSGDTIIARAIKEKPNQGITSFIYTSIDRGVTWKLTPLPSNVFEFEFYNSKKGVCLVNRKSLLTTNDGGETWTPTGINQNIRTLNISGADNGSFRNEIGQIYITNDFFKTYQPIACGLRTNGLPQILNDSSLLLLLYNSSSRNSVKIAKSTNYQTDNCNSRIDSDGDGFAIEEDCDDQNPEINPEAIEIADNNIDENCDGELLFNTKTTSSEISFQIYPNPSFDIIYFKSVGAINYDIEILNASGLKVLHREGISELVIENLIQGIYFFKVVDKSLNKSWVKKIVLL